MISGGGLAWQEKLAEEAWERAQKQIEAQKRAADLSKYAYDPVGFGEEVLGEWYTDDIRKVMESVRDNPVTLVRSATGVGKTHAAARVCIWFFSVFDDSQVYLTAAPPVDNLKRLLWGEIMSVVNKKPTMFAQFKRRSLSMHRNSLSFVAGVSIPQSGPPSERESKFSGKHSPHLMFIVDEGDAVPHEVYKGIEGCMSSGDERHGGDMARMLIMFNPRSEGTYLYYLEKRGLANVIEVNAFRHPNVVLGYNRIRGAVSQDVTVRRINKWSTPLRPDELPDAECFEVPKFLEGASATAEDGKMYPSLEPGFRRVTDPAFWYTVVGKYPTESEQQLISSAWIDAARVRYDLYVSKFGNNPPVGIRPVLGLDIAELGGDANVACLRYGGYVGNFIAWKGVDTDVTTDKALALYEEKNAEIAMIDGTGVGSSVAPSMARRAKKKGNRELRAVGVKLGEKPSPMIKAEQGDFTMIRDQLWWALREWLRTDETAMLPPDQMLLEELRAPKYKVNEHGKIQVSKKEAMRDLLHRSPDRADALCLTFTPIARAKVVRLVS